MSVEKIDLEDLIKSFKVTDKEAFKSYLKDIWNDLSQRNLEKDITGISKITFSSYYNLPGIISDRLFNVFDSNNSGVLKSSDFIKGMITFFCEDFEICCPFIFNFYDFDKDGKISKEDIRTVLSYVSLSQEIQNYKDRVHSQKELSEIIEKCFSKIKGDKMDYNNFKNIIENEASDIYLMILLFLYEKKPFTKKTLISYLKITKDSPLASPVVKSPSKLVASPAKGLSFSPYKVITRNSKRTVTLKDNISNKKMRELLDNSLEKESEFKRRGSIGNDVITLVQMNKKAPSKFKNDNSQNVSLNNSTINDEFSPIVRKDKKNLKNIGKANISKFGKKNIDDKKNIISFNEAASQPMFKQSKNNNEDAENSKSSSILSGEILDKKKEDKLDFLRF